MSRVHPDVLRSGDSAAIQASEALIKALPISEWGIRNFQTGKMTRRTLDQFAPYHHIPEVKQLVDAILSKKPVDGLMLHYLKRRYVEQETIQRPDDLNRWFSQVLQDQEAVIFKPKPGGRYIVHSKNWRFSPFLIHPVSASVFMITRWIMKETSGARFNN